MTKHFFDNLITGQSTLDGIIPATTFCWLARTCRGWLWLVRPRPGFARTRDGSLVIVPK